MIKLRVLVRALSIALLLGLAPSVLSAQAQTPAYGVDSVSTYVVTAWDMQMTEPTVGWTGSALPSGHRYATSSGGFLAGANLPQGARILSIELEACDTSATGEVTAILFQTTPTGPSTILVNANTGAAAMPGCDGFGADLAIPETVENNANRYLVFAANTSFDGSTTFGGVRIRYQLQVSPAPGTATFNDVPTSDPAFQFIEALVASGITAGCGSGNYCPDAPLTRRQMAVFMSKALGLHWPDGPQF